MEPFARFAPARFCRVRTFAVVVGALSLSLLCAVPVQATGFGHMADPRVLKTEAFSKYVEGDYEQARALYERAIEAAERAYGPNSSYVADLCFEVGSLSLEDGNFACAEKYLSKATIKNPNSIMSRIKYADLLIMKGQTGPALQQIQEALKRDPVSPEARQALVKWMMNQSSKTDQGAAANLASTWESYRLKMAGYNSVKRTIALINNFRNNLIKPTNQTSQIAIAAIPPQLQPKPESAPPAPPQVKKEPPVEAKPPEKAKEPPKPKVAREKPRPKVERPKAKPKPKPKREPVTIVASQPQSEAKSGRRAKSRDGLVPPPPPLVPVFRAPPPPPTGFRLETKARIEGIDEDTKDSERERDRERRKRERSRPKPVEEDTEPDYLLKWADVDNKKKPAKKSAE